MDAGLAAVEPKVVAWRRDLHQHPELSNREVRTAKVVADHLRRLGLEVETGVAHTGVAALLKTGKAGPTIALRADMDALPVVERTDVPFRSVAKGNYGGEEVGVMHACGHDSHTAVLMGVAEVLAKKKNELRGNVLFLFQPAEEGAPAGEEGGASLMLREGVFDRYRPEAVFGLHVWSSLNTGQLGYRSREHSNNGLNILHRHVGYRPDAPGSLPPFSPLLALHSDRTRAKAANATREE